MDSDRMNKVLNELVAALRFRGETERAEAVAALRAAARVPDGHVRVGVTDMKYAGSIKHATTIDGVLAFPGADLSWNEREGHVVDGVLKVRIEIQASIPIESWVWPGRCYSTREAAEAAGEVGGNAANG